MKSSRRSHPTYPEYLDPRRVPFPLEEQERAQVRSPSHEAPDARSCEGGECHAEREVHYRRPIGWEWACENTDYIVAPLSLRDPMPRTSDGKVSACPCEDGRATVTERTEASNIGPADRSVQARSLFLHEGRTMNPSLRRKRLWPPERRAVRVSARKCVPGQRKTRGNVTGLQTADVNNLKRIQRAQVFARDMPRRAVRL